MSHSVRLHRVLAPHAIAAAACYVGRRESLRNPARLVEPQIAQ